MNAGTHAGGERNGGSSAAVRCAGQPSGAFISILDWGEERRPTVYVQGRSHDRQPEFGRYALTLHSMMQNCMFLHFSLSVFRLLQG